MFALRAEFLSWKRVSYLMNQSFLILIEQVAVIKNKILGNYFEKVKK